MSYRGRGRGFGRGGGGGCGGGGRGGFRGGRNAGGFNKGRGGFDRGGRGYDQGPPESVTLLGRFVWPVQDDLVVKVDIEQVPFFNAPIFMQNKQQVGKIDEIFGNIRDYYVSVKLSDNIKASSFEEDMQLYIDPAKLLPLQRFLPKLPGEQKRGVSTGRVTKRNFRGRGISISRGSAGPRSSFGRGGFNNRGFGAGSRSRGGGRGRW